MFDKLKKGYEEQWHAIIRPPRCEYEQSDLGPEIFYLEDICVKRTDLELTNKKKLKLKCSWFQPINNEQPLPCVIYLHGNSSSRLEAMNHLSMLLPDNISVFCFDFSGSGQSDGQYISLGYFEKDDLEIVIDYLRESNKTTLYHLIISKPKN